MEDSGDPRDPSVSRQLRAELSFQQPREAGKGPTEDHTALFQGRPDDLRLRFAKDGGHIADVSRHRTDVTFLQLGRGGQEHYLPLDLSLDERGNHS